MNHPVALVVFAFVGSVTPGPNNTLLWASGMAFGFRRTAPHVVGTALGIGALVVAVAAGVGVLLQEVPALEVGLKVAGSGYLLFVAVQVLGGGTVGRTSVSRPLTIGQALVFQWVNPKAWIFALAAVGVYLPTPHRIADVALITSILMVVAAGSSSIWAFGGTALGRVVDDDRTRRAVSILLAALLVASVALIWI